jgi:hypothetical protein
MRKTIATVSYTAWPIYDLVVLVSEGKLGFFARLRM